MSGKTLMIDGEVRELDGKKYRAIKVDTLFCGFNICSGCAFIDDDHMCDKSINHFGVCLERIRPDGKAYDVRYEIITGDNKI